LAKKKRWKVVDASQSKDEVHKDVMKIVAKKMGL
jgi:thymidylate kinase